MTFRIRKSDPQRRPARRGGLLKRDPGEVARLLRRFISGHHGSAVGAWIRVRGELRRVRRDTGLRLGGGFKNQTPTRGDLRRRVFRFFAVIAIRVLTFPFPIPLPDQRRALRGPRRGPIRAHQSLFGKALHAPISTHGDEFVNVNRNAL